MEGHHWVLIFFFLCKYLAFPLNSHVWWHRFGYQKFSSPTRVYPWPRPRLAFAFPSALYSQGRLADVVTSSMGAILRVVMWVKQCHLHHHHFYRWYGYHSQSWVVNMTWFYSHEDVKMRRCFTDPHYWKNPALRRSRELKMVIFHGYVK